MTAPQWALLAWLSTMWGSNFLFAKLAVADIPPATLVATRSVIGTLVLGALMLAFARPGGATRRLRWSDAAVMGCFGNAIPIVLIAFSQTRIESSLAGVLNSAAPVFTIFLSHLFIADERMTGRKVAGVLAGLAGVILVIGPDALAGAGSGLVGQLAMLGACLCFAITHVYGRRIRGTEPMRLAAAQIAVAGLATLPFALLLDRPWTLEPGATALASLLVLTLYGTVLPTLVYLYLLGRTAALNVSFVSYFIPVVAIGLGVGLAGERLAVTSVLGLAVILAGVWIAQRPPAAQPAKPSTSAIE